MTSNNNSGAGALAGATGVNSANSATGNPMALKTENYDEIVMHAQYVAFGFPREFKTLPKQTELYMHELRILQL